MKRPDGTVIELQNSPMSLGEMSSREQFYGKKMVWIVNGEKLYPRHKPHPGSVPVSHWYREAMEEYSSRLTVVHTQSS